MRHDRTSDPAWSVDTRLRLVEATARLMLGQSWELPTFDAIADTSAVPRAEVAKHFRSRKNLRSTLLTEGRRRVLAASQRRAPTDMGAAEGVALTALDLVRQAENDPVVRLAYRNEAADAQPSLYDVWIRRFVELLGDDADATALRALVDSLAGLCATGCDDAVARLPVVLRSILPELGASDGYIAEFLARVRW